MILGLALWLPQLRLAVRAAVLLVAAMAGDSPVVAGMAAVVAAATQTKQ